MIPKKIHYCWFGGNPLNDMGKKCLASWKKYFPDYEIIEWNESNFDVNCCDYVREAYEAKKWAFVSDYARFKILYDYGGLYFDTDVEVIKPLNDIIARGGFMGCEKNVCSSANLAVDLGVNPGLGIGIAPGHPLYKEMLEAYNRRHFKKNDDTYNLKTIVDYTTEILVEHGLENICEIQNIAGIYIYPKEYFNPIDMSSGKLVITENTRSIHHYAASWVDKTSLMRGRIYRFIYRTLGEKNANKLRALFGRKR